MSEGKYCKIDGVIRTIVGEYCKIGGVIRTGTVNCPKIGGVIKQIPVGELYLFICEQFSDRLYAIDRDQNDLDGWPNYGNPGGGTITDPRVVACDDDGNSYWGCNNLVYKYNLAGEWQWTYTGHSAAIYSIACSKESGVTYLYTGDYDGVVKRILGPLSTPGLLWSKTIGASKAITSLAVDASTGMIYAGTGFAADEIWGGTTATGNFTRRWISTDGDVTGLAIDEGTPSLYAGTNSGKLFKLGTNGYEYWEQDKLGNIAEVRIGHDGAGYFVNYTGQKVGKFELASGTNSWVYQPAAGAAYAISVTVDAYGNVYASYRIAGSSVYNKVYKLNSLGVEQWGWQPYTSAQLYGVAVSPGIKAAGF